MLLGGHNNKTEISVNHIASDHNLKSSESLKVFLELWTLTKTESEKIVKMINIAEEGIGDNFYMSHYLDSFHTMQEVMKVKIDVTNVLVKGGVCLNQLIPRDATFLNHKV